MDFLIVFPNLATPTIYKRSYLSNNISLIISAIQELFGSLIGSFPGLNLSFDKTAVEGDLFLLEYSADSDVATIPHGVATFIIQDGMIQRQTEWMTVIPK